MVLNTHIQFYTLEFLSVQPSVLSSVTLTGHPLDSETGWTGELWSNIILLNKYKRIDLFSGKISTNFFKICAYEYIYIFFLRFLD